MTADTALGAALGAALVGICVGEWVQRQPALSPPSMFYLEMGVVRVTTALGAVLGGCVGTALSGEAPTERPLHGEPVSPPRAGLVCWRTLRHAVVCEPKEEP